jgi:predicted enzyme related to lactoylglutathione lyase
MITIVTPTMAKIRKTLGAGGLQLESDFQGDFGIIAQINDPDGNRLTLAEPPRLPEV